MVDYQKMYAILCAAASEAMDLLQSFQHQAAYQCLQNALYRAEDMYVVEQEDLRGEQISLTLLPLRDNMIDRNEYRVDREE